MRDWPRSRRLPKGLVSAAFSLKFIGLIREQFGVWAVCKFSKDAKMRKTLTAALAALTLGGAISATVVTGADARPYYHGGYYHGGRGYGGAGGAGVGGPASGAALASPHYYGGPGYYYGAPGPYYYGPPATCFTTRWVWDPYVGRNVP